MRKLLIAILLPVLTVWLAGCEGEGGFVGENENISVNITTHSQHHGSNTDYVSSNIYGDRPSTSAPYTLQVQVRVSQKDTGDGVEGVEVFLDARQPEYAMISKPDVGGDNFNDFIQCTIEDDGSLSDCGHPMRLDGVTGADGVAIFYITSTYKTCRTSDPCLELVASVPDVSTATGRRNIRVGEPGSGMPVNLLVGSEAPASIQRMNLLTTSRLQVWAYDEKDALILDPDSGVNNLRVRILQGPGGGEQLIARNAAGVVVTSDDVLIRTQSGVAELSLRSGSLTGAVLLEVTADREDNNVDNDVQESVVQHAVAYIADVTSGDPNAAPLEILTDSLPDGKVGESYVGLIEVSGGEGNYTFTIEAGHLPLGVALTSSGVIHGMPTQQGNFSILLRVVDTGGGTAQKVYNIAIAPRDEVDPPPKPEIDTDVVDPGTVGQYYAFLFEGSPVDNSLQWSLVNGDLPPGLTLAGNGLLQGTPTQAGSYTFVVQLRDQNNFTTTMKVFTMVVNLSDVDVTLYPTEEALPDGAEGVAYYQRIFISGGEAPYTLTHVAGDPLPAALVLTPDGADEYILEGTPDLGTAGDYSFVLMVEDAALNRFYRLYTLTIAP